MLILKQHHAEHAKIADLTQRVECKRDSQANQYIHFWKRALFICAWLGAIRWVHCCINPATPAVLSSGGRQFAEGWITQAAAGATSAVQSERHTRRTRRTGCWCRAKWKTYKCRAGRFVQTNKQTRLTSRRLVCSWSFMQFCTITKTKTHTTVTFLCNCFL